MTYKLFLDDCRIPPTDGWTVVKSYDEFCFCIETHGLPKMISFDHDLADVHYNGDYSTEKTGYDCAKWLVEYCVDNNLKLPEFECHSMNPVGKRNILSTLERRLRYEH